MISQLRPAFIILLLMTALTGLAYPLAMTAFAQVALPWQANGSLLTRDGAVIGSALIGQSFVDAQTGNVLPGYFRGRPSAAFTPGDGDDTLVSAGSNYGPANPALLERVASDLAQIRAENGLAVDTPVPVDLVTASGSGLDPHISPAAAALQAPRVARERGMDVSAVMALVTTYTESPLLGVLGEGRVNVLALNMALDAVAPVPAAA